MAPRQRRYQPTISWLVSAWLAGAPVLVTGCGTGSSEEQETSEVHCVDENGNVIPLEHCDETGYYNGYPVYLWLASTRHDPGYRVPAAQRQGASYFRANNPTARQNAGLSPRGRVGSTVSHSGGFGNGDGGSHSGGG